MTVGAQAGGDEPMDTESGRLDEVRISPDATITEALRHMDEAGHRILFVTDDHDVLLGVATDGDIRRWILKGEPLDAPVSSAMNAEPIVLSEGHTVDEAKELMVANRIESIPVLGDGRRVVGATWWLDLFESKPKQHAQVSAPVVIMAGGEGGRLAPFTKILPKPLVPIGDRPIIELIIERFYEAGCRDFHLTVNYKSSLIRAFFNDIERDYSMSYIEEDRPLGTAGSLSLLAGKLTDTLFVTNCDILIEADLAEVYQFHRDSGNDVTLVASMKNWVVPYGVCQLGKGGLLKGIDEKPEYNLLVSTGLYVLEPQVLGMVPADTHYDFNELIDECLAAHKRIGVYPVSEKSWLDMGQFEELQKMLTAFGIR
jgi:dTDP-glucose pyrophosphorylase